MADGAAGRADDAAHTSSRPAVRPRASGTLPWDLEARSRQHNHHHNRSNPPPGATGSTSTLAVVDDETALLQELDEVLSSTTSSKASKGTDETTADLVPAASNANNQYVDIQAANSESTGDGVASEKGQQSGVPSDILIISHNSADIITITDESLQPASTTVASRTSARVEPGMPSKADREESVNMYSIDEDQTPRREEAMLRSQESSLQQEDKRAPRYHQGQFSSYEQMLEQMEKDDPFGGQQPPVSDRKPPSTRSGDRPRHGSNRPTQYSRDSSNKPSRNNREANHHDKEARRERRRLRKSKSEDVTRSGYTNPAYDMARRDSADSTKTYIVGRADSRTALVDERKLSMPVDERRLSIPKATKAAMMGSIPSLIGAAAELGSVLEMDFSADEHFRTLGIDINSARRHIKQSFHHRQCSKYLPTSNDSTKCGCGRELWMHEPIGVATNPVSGTVPKWNPKDHSRKLEPSTFGTISFHGFGQDSQKFAPYLRIDETTRSSNDSMRNVWRLMRDIWQMPPPKMLVSVTGGAKRFFMKNRLKNSFKRGLINVATSSGAWIITGGTATGVMQFVGEAVRDHQLTAGGANDSKVVALGIATWGILDNKQALISEGDGNFPAHYSIEHLSNKKGTAPLDPNHTHFLLVDDGTHCKFGKEILFRTAFESFISNRLTGVSESQGVHVPVVLLVLEGGVNTLETVFQALEKGTPVVIIQGSGRAADFIAIAYKEIRGWDEESKAVLDEDIQLLRARNMFEWKEGEEPKGVEKVVATLKKILSPQHRPKLTVFHMDDVDTTKEIDEAILFALLKAKRSDAQQQLNLALAWNRCDVARQQIFDIENRGNWQTLDLNKSMLIALLQDRADFVQLFIDNGVDLNKFLTKNTLRRLYADVVNDRTSDMSARLLRHLLQEAQTQWCGISCLSDEESHTGPISCFRRDTWTPELPHLLRIVGRVMNSLLGEHNENIYRDARYIIPVDEQHREREQLDSPTPKVQQIKAEQAVLNATSANSSYLHPDKILPAYMRLYASATSAQENDDDNINDIPERDLFLWAVMLNRRDLAQLFWRAGQDHIGGALTASAILHSLAEQAEDDEEIELSQELFKHSEDWEKTAIGVLTECYQRDKEMSHDLLVREIPCWGNSTLFVMADSAELMDFMGHSACQTKLNRIWKGKMALHTPMWKIILCMFMPFFLPLIRFATGEFSRRFRRSKKPNFPEKPKPSPTKAALFGSVNQVGAAQDNTLPQSNYEEAAESEQSTCAGGKGLSAFGSFLYYHQAPVTKFVFHTLSYIMFLVLFSFFILTDMAPLSVRSPSVVEYIVWGWAGTLFLEELRQISTQDPKTLTSKIAGYFESNWNRFDQVMHVFLIISIILRHLLDGGTFVWARVFYSFTLAMYFIRFMQFFFVEKNIGPKVIMIRRMLTDLTFFIAILVTVMLAYGVAVQSLRFPDSSLDWNLLKEVVYKPYWHIYGELFLEDLEGEVSGCSYDRNIWQNATAGVPRCPEKNGWVLGMLALYMIMTNVLLLNLLIAMFSYTFEKVQDNSEKVWRYYFYSLVYEYFDKPTLAPPLIIISHIIRVIKYCVYKCHCTEPKTATDFRKKLNPAENHALMAFERAGMENYLLKMRKTDREHIDAKVSTASERIEKVIEDLEQIKEQVGQSQTPEADNLMATLNTARDTLTLSTTPRAHHFGTEAAGELRERVMGLEQQISHQAKSMEKMAEMLKEMKEETMAAARAAPPSDSHSVHSSSTSTRPYRRMPYHTEPSIEIQDLPPSGPH